MPHVRAVAFYMQKLIYGEGGEEKVLLPVAYLHDIGYMILVMLVCLMRIMIIKII